MKTDMCERPHTNKIIHTQIVFYGSLPSLELLQILKLTSDHIQRPLVIAWKE